MDNSCILRFETTKPQCFAHLTGGLRSFDFRGVSVVAIFLIYVYLFILECVDVSKKIVSQVQKFSRLRGQKRRKF